MLRYFTTLGLAVLAGCANIIGPCAIDAISRAASCERGGSMILIPAPTFLPLTEGGT